MLAITAKTPVRMTQDFGKRAKKDVKKVSKAFERLQADKEARRAKMDETMEQLNARREKMSSKIDDLLKQIDAYVRDDDFLKQVDKIARDDVDKLKSLVGYDGDDEETVDIDDFVEADDIVTFKD
jgi:TolA-binding protein